MLTQRGIENLTVVHLSAVATSFLLALVSSALIGVQRSLQEAQRLFGVSMVMTAVFMAGGMLSLLIPWIADRGLLYGWHTTETRRLRRLVLPIPAINGLGLLIFLALAPSLGAIPPGLAAILAILVVVMMVGYVVTAPRYFARGDLGPHWCVRRFPGDAPAFSERLRLRAAAEGLVPTAIANGGLELRVEGETVAVVRPRTRGGSYARVRLRDGAQGLMGMMEDAAR